MMWSLSDGSLLAALVAAVFSGKQYERFLRHDAGADQYLSIAEVRDIMDEIERPTRRFAAPESGRPLAEAAHDMDQDADEVVKIEHELEILRSRYALMERWARVLRMCATAGSPGAPTYRRAGRRPLGAHVASPYMRLGVTSGSCERADEPSA